jgi:uncharacterized protein YndB with AHSA1/START domain
MTKQKITVEATISADIHTVWNYWTAPEHVVNWNFASDDWHCPKAENDPKTGGKFSFTMASKDGKMSFDFEGIYDEVIESRKIAYTMPDERQVVVSFENLNDGKTKVTESFDPENTHPEEIQRAGWQSILNNFKKYAETK